MRAAAAETDSRPPSSIVEVDEKNEFAKLMEDAGVKHQVRLASGSRGRGLFPTGVTGWNNSSVLLSVPLDICIAAPFGDEDAIKAEFKDGSKDTLVILRRTWEARNNVKIPMAITKLLDSTVGDDRELAIVLWLVWATKAGGKIWKEYADWLPQPGNMPSLLLADEKELSQLQDDDLADAARTLQARIVKAYERLPAVNAAATEMAGAPVPDMTLEELAWGFALVASRAVASPVGDSDAVAAVLVPFFDMANHDDARLITALKSVRGTEDSEVSGGVRVKLEKALNQGVGGPRMVLETTRALKGADDEIVINYDSKADNRELMLRYGFSLRCNRNDRVPRPSVPDPAAKAKLDPSVLQVALEEKGVIAADTSMEDRTRLILVVGSACGGLGSMGTGQDGDDEQEEEAWELNEEDVAREAAAAGELRRAWCAALDAFETTLNEDVATLTAASAGNLPGATPNIVSALEYRVERKKVLNTAVTAMDAYLEWLEEDDEEEMMTMMTEEEEEEEMEAQ